jgi:hypothetical protein
VKRGAQLAAARNVHYCCVLNTRMPPFGNAATPGENGTYAWRRRRLRDAGRRTPARDACCRSVSLATQARLHRRAVLQKKGRF